MVFSRVFTSCRQNPPRMRKSDKDFKRELDFKDIKFLVKIKDIHKAQKKNCISISVLGFENEEKFPIYISKKILEEEGQSHHVLIKDFSTFMYNQTLHCN